MFKITPISSRFVDDETPKSRYIYLHVRCIQHHVSNFLPPSNFVLTNYCKFGEKQFCLHIAILIPRLRLVTFAPSCCFHRCAKSHKGKPHPRARSTLIGWFRNSWNIFLLNLRQTVAILGAIERVKLSLHFLHLPDIYEHLKKKFYWNF